MAFDCTEISIFSFFFLSLCVSVKASTSVLFFFYLVLGIRGWFDIMGGVRFVFPIPLYSVALLLFLSGGMYYYYYYFYNCLLIYLALEWMAVPHRLA